MKYPMINRQPRREVNIPQLSGGLNLRDSLTGVRDNQITDCVNMWYKDGMLRTRPAISKSNWAIGGLTYVEKTKIFYDITKDDAVLVSYCAKTFAGGVNIDFYWQSKTELISAGGFRVYYYTLDEEVEYFVVEKDGVLYCYTNKCKIFKCDYKSESEIWTLVDLSESYVPTVYAHCQRYDWWKFTGTMLEGYNLINDKYKMVYSAYNEADSDSSHPMRYGLGRELADSGKITVDITIYDDTKEKLTTVTHSIEYTEEVGEAVKAGSLVYEKFEDGKEPEDNLYLFVWNNCVGFSFKEGLATVEVAVLDTPDRVKKYGYIEDNITITAPYNSSEDDLKKVFNMTQNTWFGGAANGINGGSRLFLCGNTNDSEKSLVLWSALNNPLYFNENNYAYVGNKSEPVTAFGKQGENLIILKEKSTYYSYYSANNEITADDLINQTVVDFEANSACFPIITLHPSIGCDCPDTIQLCRNRLVWLSSDGKVYTLVSANQYSEMSIYIVSDMIEQRLLGNYSAEQLRKATSHDFEGYYVLMIGIDAYVMDYNSYGYTHIYGYSKTEDANSLIPWYYWEFSIQGENVKFYGFKDFIFSFYTLNDYSSLTFCVLSSSSINENFYKEKIVSRFQTKMFDFLAAGYLKNIDRVSVGLGNNGGEPISVSFVTDKGSESDTVMLWGESTDERDAAFVRCKNFYPTARAVRTFGVKIECEGPLVVDGLSLQYRMLGGVK